MQEERKLETQLVVQRVQHDLPHELTVTVMKGEILRRLDKLRSAFHFEGEVAGREQVDHYAPVLSPLLVI